MEERVSEEGPGRQTAVSHPPSLVHPESSAGRLDRFLESSSAGRRPRVLHLLNIAAAAAAAAPTVSLPGRNVYRLIVFLCFFLLFGFSKEALGEQPRKIFSLRLRGFSLHVTVCSHFRNDCDRFQTQNRRYNQARLGTTGNDGSVGLG